MIQEFDRMEKLYLEFENAYRDFSEKDQAARTTISIVSRRITDAKKETDAGIQECKTIIADSGRTAAAQSAAAIRLEVLLSRTFPVTPEETAAMNEAVAAADVAFSTVSRVRTDFDESHGAALRKLKEMRDAVFGNVPSAMNLMHTNQLLHDRLRAVQEGK